MVDGGAGADAGAVIQQIQQWVMAFVIGKPAVGCGVQLPERSRFEALPAPGRGRRAAGRLRMGQTVSHGPTPHRGRVQ